jgi:hypothetical protein
MTEDISFSMKVISNYPQFASDTPFFLSSLALNFVAKRAVSSFSIYSLKLKNISDRKQVVKKTGM